MAYAQNPSKGLMREAVYNPAGKTGQVAMAADLGWTTVGIATGTEVISIANVIDAATELQITAYAMYTNSDVEVFYSQVISAESLDATGRTARLCLGGYYASTGDYGSCWCNVSRSGISLRHFVYAGKDFEISSVGIKVRYR